MASCYDCGSSRTVGALTGFPAMTTILFQSMSAYFFLPSVYSSGAGRGSLICWVLLLLVFWHGSRRGSLIFRRMARSCFECRSATVQVVVFCSAFLRFCSWQRLVLLGWWARRLVLALNCGFSVIFVSFVWFLSCESCLVCYLLSVGSA